jgi:hypothetical protein
MFHVKQFTELKNSPYICETESGVKFVFSTRMRKERFEKTYLQNRKEMMTRLFTRYGVRCVCSLASDINTYRRIETNGFYVVLPDGAVHTIDALIFRMVRT